ncbi:Calcium/calmodulin-dependent protein kinase type 1 [Escovopsis weberi]|uniref:non-specific serine/threonine protein kinase n=1 Tax=Escovopsis weberi TaxID=150374 RepID=A0A0M8N3A0_ESCWE|nr:Calcium/calmodulin-dependent protein kinase type 1 [Escovopsis weberi]
MRGNQWILLRGEAELLRKIRHDNIVRCLFTTEIPKRRLVFEYMPLGTLQYQAWKQPITSAENIEVLTQALAALRFLHGQEKPIAHREVKPDNILVCSRDPLHIKLADFGISKKKQQNLRTYTGTDRYMAPEIMFQRPYSEIVDI